MIRTVQDLIDKLEELPKTAKVIQLRECKACFSLVEEKPVRYYRLDIKDQKKRKHFGFNCTKCGYINDEN